MLSAVPGTEGHTKGLQKCPRVLGSPSAVKRWRWKELEGISQLTRETAIKMAIYFILGRVVDLKSLGQIRNRSTRVLKALQLRNDSWKQRREARMGRK